MSRPTDALVTGFCKSPALVEKSFAPLRRLRQEGHIRHIHYVTWDDAGLDAHVAPMHAMNDVTITRVQQPEIEGAASQRGVVYQVENLAAGLALLPGDGGLVLKTRPDFVADAALLRDKIVNFAAYCAVPAQSPFGIAMPGALFENRIWIPWADSNQPFFFEDALFLATAADAAKLVTRLSPQDRRTLGEPGCGSYAHVVRFAKLFLARYPLFANYLKFYRFFASDLDYRMKLVPFLLDDGFFWHLLVAHAWILHSHFHVDAGAPGALNFYANNVNREADWSKLESLRVANPYDDISLWRNGTKPGLLFASVSRAFGRLVDDGWQAALFTRELPDLPRATLAALMDNVAHCGDGRLAEIERTFYRGLQRLYATHRPQPARAI